MVLLEKFCFLIMHVQYMLISNLDVKGYSKNLYNVNKSTVTSVALFPITQPPWY